MSQTDMAKPVRLHFLGVNGTKFVTEFPGNHFPTFLSYIFTNSVMLIFGPKVEITSVMNVGQSFRSSSSTLAAGLELMQTSVDELVKNALSDDPEEQELLKQLEDLLCNFMCPACNLLEGFSTWEELDGRIDAKKKEVSKPKPPEAIL